jgi:hypothetical protein
MYYNNKEKLMYKEGDTIKIAVGEHIVRAKVDAVLNSIGMPVKYFVISYGLFSIMDWITENQIIKG